MTEPTRATTGALEPRFIIERIDGKPIPASRRYSMVLDFSGADPHAIVAASAYADSIEAANPEMAAGIHAALADPANAPAQHRYA
jgi:hypothetical protein